MTAPCEHCGHEFDHDLLGPDGGPNCRGEGLRSIPEKHTNPA
jgi:predicted Zn-ribbon and HTH transcriptional regulator